MINGLSDDIKKIFQLSKHLELDELEKSPTLP